MIGEFLKSNAFKFAAQKIFLSLFAALFAAFALGCPKHRTAAQAAAEKQILLVGNAADPEGLDPTLTTGLCEFRILSALFEGLVTADSSTLKILPAAANCWTVSEDGKTYTFKIDKDAYWSNGDKLTADDFIFAWKRALNPSIGAEYASMLSVIKNANAVRSGKLPPEELGAKAPDKDTLEVELETQTPYFLSMLTHNIFLPLHKKTLEKFGAVATRDAKWTRPQNMVSNGAFTLKSWSLNDCVKLVKNPKFRAAKNVKLNGINFYPISNINTEDRAFRAGQLHVTESISPIRLPSIRRDFPQCLRNETVFGVYYYIFNTSKFPLNDWRVRKALSLSINRAAIIDNFLRGGQLPALSYIPPNCGGYNFPDNLKISENVKLAKELLAQAGFKDGKNFPKLRLTYNTSEQHKPIAEAIQQMWKNNLGIEIELYNLSWPAYLDARQRGEFDIARSSWFADFPAPENFLENFQSTSGLNHSKYADKFFDDALAKAKKAGNFSERQKCLQSAENRLLQSAALMPIYFYSRLNLVSDKVKNWHTNPLDYRNWQNIELEAEGGKTE